MTIYSIITVIWFIFLCNHLYFIDSDTNEYYTVYNSVPVLLVICILSILWIITIPLYIIPEIRNNIGD